MDTSEVIPPTSEDESSEESDYEVEVCTLTPSEVESDPLIDMDVKVGEGRDTVWGIVMDVKAGLYILANVSTKYTFTMVSNIITLRRLYAKS